MRDSGSCWSPQPKQYLALTCPAIELLFGGAAGGGKSDFLLADAFSRASIYKGGFRGVLFRRSFPQLEELIIRGLELFGDSAVYYEQKKLFAFRDGGFLKMRFIESDKDVYNYQGHQYSWLGWDELGQYPTDYCYRYMISRLRSAKGVPCVIRATANPGGPGNAWIKTRFIDGFDPLAIHTDPETGNTLVFIQSFLADNQALVNNDPGYERRLDALTEHERRALKFGDWDVFAGQVFSEFRKEAHMVKPFTIPAEYVKFAAMDWGYQKPYSIGWYAVDPDGRVIRYREMYGCSPTEPNKGLKKGAREVAAAAWEYSAAEGVSTMIADPACWSKIDDTTSIADSFENIGWTMVKADNARISGLAKIHELMQTIGHDGKPMFLVFNTCYGFARTIPTLVCDPRKPEDVDTTQEDHIYDEVRYAVMSQIAKNPLLVRRASHYQPQQTTYDPLNYGL